MERNESHSCVLASVDPMELQPRAWRVLTILFSLLVFFFAWCVVMCSGKGLGILTAFGTDEETNSFTTPESRSGSPGFKPETLDRATISRFGRS